MSIIGIYLKYSQSIFMDYAENVLNCSSEICIVQIRSCERH